MTATQTTATELSPTAELRVADGAAWALWLRAVGLDQLGAPPVERSGRQRAALREVAWPTTPAGGRSR